MAKLYEIVESLEAVLAGIGDDGEMPEDLAAKLDALELDLRTKVDNVCRVIRQAEGDLARYTEEAARLTALAKAEAARVAWLRNYVRDCLDRVHLGKLDTDFFKVAIQKNGRPAVRLAANAPIPEAFKRTRHEFDSQAAYDAYREGQQLPAGIIVEHGTHLRIR